MLQFDPKERLHLFALPPGVNFAVEAARGLINRLPQDPVALARCEIFVNTRRMQRHLTKVFSEKPRLLPRIRLLTDIGSDPSLSDLPAAVPKLQRRLELTQLVSTFLEKEPRLGAGHASFALADSLGDLLSEMSAEGVSSAALAELDVSDQSGHWERALSFVKIAQDFAENAPPEAEQRQRAAIETLIAKWESKPPDHPVIIAGSTGSRGATELLMKAVAKLPNGAVILPGFDTMATPKAWEAIGAPLSTQDHSQYRFARMARDLGLEPAQLPPWTDTFPKHPSRNALISLALRPAPVTDQWRREGPLLTDLDGATKGLTLIEAPSPRIEAEAIALRLRDAAESGKTAALVTPDRVLTRQVAAALNRYGIVPDDSAGEPLHLTTPGRLIRQAAECFMGPISTEGLLCLLKHPLAHSHENRIDHLQSTRELELYLRRNGPPWPTPQSIADFVKNSPKHADWGRYVTSLLGRDLPDSVSLEQRTDALLDLCSDLCGKAGRLWDGEAGRQAKSVMESLSQQARFGADMGASDFAALITSLLSGEEVRRQALGHPTIKIWGTLEARVQNADLMILAGLNETVWPRNPDPDPWLNRAMRAQAGLLLPDLKIGLSAHDFEQAIASKEVVLSRSVRSDESETVPSRWLNRITNLLEGLEQGAPLLKRMRQRGAEWITRAEQLERARIGVPAAHRPSPIVPVEKRPTELRVTELSLLHRDPYALYARRVLRLNALDPLVMNADARTRGIAVHEVMERFVTEDLPLSDVGAFVNLAHRILDAVCPWPTARVLWKSQIAQIAEPLLAAEAKRSARAETRLAEISGKVMVPGTNVLISGRADRIDITPDGSAILYDYKTGDPPSVEQQKTLDKQLLVESAMVTHGAFEKLGKRHVIDAHYLKVGNGLKEVSAPLDETPPEQVWADLQALIQRWMAPEQGYTARMAARSDNFRSDYDQLARFGEWDLSHPPMPERLA